MFIKSLVLGGAFWFFGGGGADFIFMGTGIFLRILCEDIAASVAVATP